MPAKNFEFLAFLRGYISAALFTSTDENGEPFEGLYSADDISAECMRAMNASCQDFCRANMPELMEYCAHPLIRERSSAPEELAGHDFWLTRNGHGAGFWDRGLGKLGDRLTEASEIYGSVDLYLGDDGFIYGEIF